MFKLCVASILTLVTCFLTYSTYLLSSFEFSSLHDLSLGVSSAARNGGQNHTVDEAFDAGPSIGDQDVPITFQPTWTADESPKYYDEMHAGKSQIIDHYDRRFFRHMVSPTKRSQQEKALVRSYLRFFALNNLETWLAHGSLLGWWWNQKTLPWDCDVDTQVSLDTLATMAERFNGTIFEPGNDFPDQPDADVGAEPIPQIKGRDETVHSKYLLDVNAGSTHRLPGLGNNVIDARWIDITNGLYIDITAIGRAKDTDEWIAKDKHHYQSGDIWPLKLTTFEKSAAFVPHDSEKILRDEYDPAALTRPTHHGHRFDYEQRLWLPAESPDS